jgi:hypothetical protein
MVINLPIVGVPLLLTLAYGRNRKDGHDTRHVGGEDDF